MRGLTRRSMIQAAAASTILHPLRAQADAPLSFGLTPVLLDSDIALLDLMQAYLQEALNRPVNLVKRRTYQEITALLLSGELDAAWICGFPYIQHWDRLSLIVVPLYHGQPLYQSYIIVPKDRAVTDWQELRGDIHAFSDPDSNSGHLVTWALLADAQETPQTFFRQTFYTYGHRNVVRAVATGLAQSGSVDGYVWDVIRDREPALANQTKVLRRSEWLGFPPVVHLKTDRDSGKIDQLSAALQSANKSQKGRDLLAMLELDGFAPEQPSLFNAIAAKYTLVKSREG
ncbi:MAG TPA: PhnD/SsuA/transferrin family substrate-binding protein [Dongiaceae bacterium]|jgi:phosphonate transport system substrate-binding protein|nr:PhnD/SsuA/transferrin family substrate-binding protein [Dongiaceae bacterium]